MDMVKFMGGPSFDLTSEKDFDVAIRLSWTGVIAVAFSATMCSKHSALRERRPGPPPLRTEQDMEGSFLEDANQMAEHQDS